MQKNCTKGTMRESQPLVKIFTDTIGLISMVQSAILEAKSLYYDDLIDFVVLFPNPANDFVKVNMETNTREKTWY
ncbi:MAG: hypothetical protein R2788_11000 [Saprospiraceae bacterium]